jgi:ribonuclease HI
MIDWIHKWLINGWINSAGNEVANRNLIQQVSDLDDQLNRAGKAEYIWIPRHQNQDADEAANGAMDGQY